MAKKEKVNILLVDDHPENLIALEAILDAPDYHLVKTRSGEEALKSLLHHDFAVILLDVHMPGLDGFETAALIKKREKSRHIPIIFLTAVSKSHQSIFRGYSVGAVDYVLKPFEPEILRSKVAIFVDLFNKNQQIKQQAELLRQSEERERRRELAELERASKQRYRNLAESIPQMVWTAQPEGGIDYYNWRWFDYTGLTFEQSRGWGWKTALHPDDLARCLEEWARALESGESYAVECRIRSGDGGYRWHLVRALAERDIDGRIIGWLGTSTDIDDPKRAKEALDQFKATLDATLDSVFIFGMEDLRFSYVNQGAINLLGYTREEFLEMTPLEVMPEFDEPRFRSLVVPLVEGSLASHTFEATYRNKEKNDIPVEIFLQYITPHREMGRFVAIVRDITERKRIQEALAAEKERLALALDKAEEASRLKSHFVSNVSHELRTPLNAIIGYSALLLDKIFGEINPRQQESILSLQKNANELLSLINNLLDLAKIESGKTAVVIEEVDFRSLLSEVSENIKPLLNRKAIEVGWQMASDLSPIKSDPMKVRQVILNLLSNAIKFTQKGTIVISAKKNEASWGRGRSSLSSSRIWGLGRLKDPPANWADCFGKYR